MEAKNKKVIILIGIVMLVSIVAIVIFNMDKGGQASNNLIITNQHIDNEEDSSIQWDDNIILPQDPVDENPSTTISTPIDEKDRVESSKPTM